jgi:hypothetical protein
MNDDMGEAEIVREEEQRELAVRYVSSIIS